MLCFLLAESNACGSSVVLHVNSLQSKSTTCLSPRSLSLGPISLCAVEGGECRKEKEGKSTVMDPLALVVPVRPTAMGNDVFVHLEDVLSESHA